MSRPVYSTRFLRISGEGYQSATYTVPAGSVAIVTDVTAFLDGAAGANCECYIEAPSSWLLYAVTAAAGTAAPHWSGRVVLNAGEVLAADVDASAVASLLASGYILSA